MNYRNNVIFKSVICVIYVLFENELCVWVMVFLEIIGLLMNGMKKWVDIVSLVCEVINWMF